MARVFVYGTLRTGQSNHDLLGQASKLGSLPACVRLFAIQPWLLSRGKKSSLSNTPLYGEVYDVDSNTMALLDQLEEYPELYTRELVDTEFGGVAWIYLYCLSILDLPLIQSGDWCRK